MATRLIGWATAEGTARYAARFAARVTPGHFRGLGGELTVASVGLGTYLGPEDGATDVLYQDAVARALERGLNVLDTAVNYRHQRSERAIRTALAAAVDRGLVKRDEVVVATKGGFIAFDGAVPPDPRAWFTRTYLDTGIVGPEDVAAARDVGGPDHRFGVIQLPYNLAMTEAFTRANQKVEGRFVPLLEAARRLGVYVMASASVYQGQLTRRLPPLVAELLPGLATDAQRALQFVRSTPGLGTALVGMRTIAHVDENAGVARVAPAPWAQFQRFFAADGSAR